MKPDDLCSIPRPHMVVWWRELSKVSSDLYRHTVAPVHTSTHAKISQCNKKTKQPIQSITAFIVGNRNCRTFLGRGRWVQSRGCHCGTERGCQLICFSALFGKERVNQGLRQTPEWLPKASVVRHLHLSTSVKRGPDAEEGFSLLGQRALPLSTGKGSGDSNTWSRDRRWLACLQPHNTPCSISRRFIYFLLYVCVCFICKRVCVPHVCQVPREVNPETGELWMVVWCTAGASVEPKHFQAEKPVPQLSNWSKVYFRGAPRTGAMDVSP